MIEMLLILGLVLLLVGIVCIAYGVLKCRPGRIVLSDDPQADYQEMIDLKRALDDAIDRLQEKSVREELQACAERIAKQRYRLYPSAFIRNCAVAVVLFVACLCAFVISEVVQEDMPMADAAWNIFAIALLVAAIGIAVAAISGVYLPNPARTWEGQKYTNESRFRLPAPCFLSLDSALSMAEQFGGYTLLDARPYLVTLEYPLEGSLSYYQSDEGGFEMEGNRHLDTFNVHHIIPDHEKPVFVVSEYGKESNEVACMLRDVGYRHAFDLGGIANCYGHAAKVCFVLHTVYKKEAETS